MIRLCSNGCCYECPDCEVKSGAPTLCSSCLARRANCPAEAHSVAAAIAAGKRITATPDLLAVCGEAAELLARLEDAEMLAGPDRKVPAALRAAIAKARGGK